MPSIRKVKKRLKRQIAVDTLNEIKANEMNKRKTKSRMTRVDLDAVLKLQREYDYLESEVRRTFELALALCKGKVDAVDYKLRSDNDFIHYTILKMVEMAKMIKELEEKDIQCNP